MRARCITEYIILMHVVLFFIIMNLKKNIGICFKKIIEQSVEIYLKKENIFIWRCERKN